MTKEILTVVPMDREDVLRVVGLAPGFVTALLHTGRVLAGGFIRDVLLGETPKDLDVFCASAMDADWCAKLATDALAVEWPLVNVRRSTFSRTIQADPEALPAQFVFYREFLDAEDLVSQFDFRACAAGIYWDPTQGEFRGVCVSGFYEDLAAKRLTFLHQPKDAGSLVPLKRALHLAAKGWKLPDESTAAILGHWQPSLAQETTLRSLRPGSYGGRR